MNDSTTSDELDLSSYVGGDCGPYNSWDAVNTSMIRHWCEAMDDNNPIYTDPIAAREQGFTDVVAPPAMLQAWTMVGLAGKQPPGSTTENPMAMLSVLEDAGFAAVVAVNCEQEYLRYLLPGDQVYYRSSIEDISTKKTTALGIGYFVTQLVSFYDQDDALVGTMRFRVFKYRPREAVEASR